jgi:hypothetical protein
MRTDDLVREALADLAPTAPADSSALAGVHRAIGRRRRRQHVARAVAAVALAAAAIGTGALVLRAEDDNVQVGNGGDGRPTTTETTTAPEPDASGRITFGPVTFQLPEGWHQIDHRNTRGEEASGESMCIGPLPNGYPRWDDCGGLLIYQGDFLPGNEGRPYERDSLWGWYHNTDVAQCPFSPGPLGGGAPDDGVQVPTEGMAPIDSGTAAMGDRTAYYDQWSAVCESGQSFQPRAWYLPTSKVLILDVTGHPETEDFLASFEFDE